MTPPSRAASLERPSADRPALVPVLGLFDVTMVVMGSIIGAGVFQAPSTIARDVGSLPGILILWALGGAIALCGALVFAELGGMMPHAGGQYVFLREGFGRFVAFLFGWLLLSAIVSSAIAYVARVFVDHLETLARAAWPAVSFGEGAARAIAFGLIVFLTALNVLGVRLGATVQNLAMVTKISGILLIVGLGLLGLLSGAHPSPAPGGLPTTGPAVASPFATGAASTGPPQALGGWTWAGAGAALLSIVFAYGGWQNSSAVASEIKDPQRTVPRGILLGTIAVVGLYLALNWSLVSILGIQGLAASRTPVAAAAGAVFRGGEPLVAALVIVSTFAITQVLLMLIPRIYYAMALDGVFFRAAARVQPRFRTPAVAILIQSAFACGHLFLGRTLDLLQVTVIADWTFFSLCGLALFVLRRTKPDASRPYRALGYPWLPGFFLACSIGVVVNALFNAERVAVARAGAVLAVGLALYVFWSRRRRPDLARN